MKSYRPLLVATLAAIDAASSAEPEGVLPTTGANLRRGTDGWLNMTIDGDRRFIVTFFDRRKTIMAPPVGHGFVHILDGFEKGGRIVLRRERHRLVSSPVAHLPRRFLSRVVVFAEGRAEAFETHELGHPVINRR